MNKWQMSNRRMTSRMPGCAWDNKDHRHQSIHPGRTGKLQKLSDDGMVAMS